MRYSTLHLRATIYVAITINTNTSSSASHRQPPIMPAFLLPPGPSRNRLWRSRPPPSTCSTFSFALLLRRCRSPQRQERWRAVLVVLGGQRNHASRPVPCARIRRTRSGRSRASRPSATVCRARPGRTANVLPQRARAITNKIKVKGECRTGSSLGRGRGGNEADRERALGWRDCERAMGRAGVLRGASVQVQADASEC